MAGCPGRGRAGSNADASFSPVITWWPTFRSAFQFSAGADRNCWCSLWVGVGVVCTLNLVFSRCDRIRPGDNSRRISGRSVQTKAALAHTWDSARTVAFTSLPWQRFAMYATRSSDALHGMLHALLGMRRSGHCPFRSKCPYPPQ